MLNYSFSTESTVTEKVTPTNPKPLRKPLPQLISIPKTGFKPGGSEEKLTSACIWDKI